MAQQIDPQHGAPGTLVQGIDQKIGGAQFPPAQRQSALVLAGKVRDILQHDPAVGTPAGYSVRVHRAYGKVTDWARFDSGLQFYAGAFGTFFAAAAKPSPTHFGNPDFGIYINTVLQCPLDTFTPPNAEGKGWMVNGNLPVLLGGHRTGEIHGFAVYDGQCAILGRGGQPPFLPLTREQYLHLEIDMLKARQEKMRAQFAGQTIDPAVRDVIQAGDKAMDQAIAQKQQQLASMSPNARKAPAAVAPSDQEKLAGPDDEDAMPLSTPNPEFFDSSLPPTTIQSIAVYMPFMQAEERVAWLPAGLPNDWIPAAHAIRDQLDWAAFAALVKAQ